MPSNEISMIGMLLRRYRVENGESANSLAKKLTDMFGEGNSPSRQMIANLENGQKKDVTVTELLQFSQALGVSPIALICDIEQPYEPSDTPTTNAALNKAVFDWFNVRDFQPYAFDKSGAPKAQTTPSGRRLHILMDYLFRLYEARAKARDSYMLFKRVLVNAESKNPKDDTDRIVADWLKTESYSQTSIADTLKEELLNSGMVLNSESTDGSGLDN